MSLLVFWHGVSVVQHNRLYLLPIAYIPQQGWVHSPWRKYEPPGIRYIVLGEHTPQQDQGHSPWRTYAPVLDQGNICDLRLWTVITDQISYNSFVHKY